MTAATQDGPAPARRAEIVAFASPGQSRAGQTSLVANTAWILSTTGRRVLALDGGTSPPPIGDYLGAPTAREQPDEALAAAAELLGIAEPVLDRYLPPRHAGPGLIDVMQAPMAKDAVAADGWARVRETLRASAYDILLVDAPQWLGLSHDGLARLGDTVVICFRPGQVPVSRLLRMTENLLAADRPPRLVTVLTQFTAIQQTAESLRHREDRFSGLSLVEIPQHAYHDRLAALLDDGPARDGLVEVVRLITAGEVSGPGETDPGVRSWYRNDFADLAGFDPVGTVRLVYHPADRRWADWVRAEVERCGADTELVLSGAGDTPGAEPDAIVVIGSRVPGAGPSALRIHVDGRAPAPVTAPEFVIDLSSTPEPYARGLLLTHLGMRPRTEPPGPGSFRPRYPGVRNRARPVTELPPGDGQFVGRVHELEALRDRLLAAPGEPVAIVGVPGAGKTELALEYARRFADDYDIVWWVPAESRDAIDQSLSRLCAELDAGSGRSSDPVTAPMPAYRALGRDARSALAQLADRESPRPYLLIFDNLRDAGDLDTLPGNRHGHVLIVAQPGVLAAGATAAVELGPLRASDSIALLQRAVPDMTAEDAGAVAEATGHLPLALRLAGAWLEDQVGVLFRMAPAAALVTVRAAATALREEIRPDGPEAGIRRIWSMVRENLHRTPTGQLAVRLAELCAYLSGDRIGLRLIRSTPMVAALLAVGGEDADRLVADPIEFDRVLWTGSRFGVFEVAWGPEGTLRMNSALQQAIRDSLPADVRADRRTQVQLVLARFAPGILEDDDREQQARLRELQPHLIPCGAIGSTDVTVRRWVVRQIRYMQLQQVAKISEAALALAEQALTSWRQAGTAPDDSTLLWLRVEYANIRRSRSDYDLARQTDEEVRDLLLAGSGEEHLRSLIVARGLAADMWAAGRYEDAAHFDRIAYDGFRQLLGHDHAHTLMSAHNLTVSSHLNGDVHTAIEIERDVLQRRLRLLGEGSFRTWWTAGCLGVYQREIGDVEAAQATLDQARGWVIRALGTGWREDPAALRVELGFLTTAWRAGRMTAPTAVTELEELVNSYERAFGDHHPNTWVCQLALAAARHGDGESREAATLTQSLLDRYMSSSTFGADHPFTAVCRLNLAVYRHAAGDPGQACALGEKAWKVLSATLSGESHPWVLAAMIDQSGHLAATGRLDEAADLARQALDLAQEDLPSRHPYTATARTVAAQISLARTGARTPFAGIDIDLPAM